MRIMGDTGRRTMDMVTRMATMELVGLFVCHCFMWFVVCGGRVIVAQYARRR